MIAPPIRPRYRQESGIAAASRLAHRGTPYGASLSFATTTHLWPLSDPPSRKPANATGHRQAARSIPGRALASSMLDSPCQGSRTGLTPPISTSVPSTLDCGSALRAFAFVEPRARISTRYRPWGILVIRSGEKTVIAGTGVGSLRFATGRRTQTPSRAQRRPQRLTSCDRRAVGLARARDRSDRPV